MNVNELKAVSEQLKSKGVDISPAVLESCQTLLVQQEIDLNPTVNDVVRLSLLKIQNPQLNDYQIIELFLKSKQESLTNQSGYGDAISTNIENEIWNALEASGVFETIAQNLQARSIDAVLHNLSGGFNSERFNARLNALSQANQRFNSRSLKADENIIDADFSESLDDVISQCLPPATDTPKLLSGSEMFHNSNTEVNGAKKPSLNGTGKGS